MPKQSKTELKKQIRNTTRLLKKKEQTLTATQLLDIQRKLKFLETELETTESSSFEQKIHQKYKYVKFIELKKCNRSLKQLSKLIIKKEPQLITQTVVVEAEVESDEEEHKYDSLSLEELREEHANQKECVDYITYFPKDLKYISIFTVDPKSRVRVVKIKDFLAERDLKGMSMNCAGKDIFGETHVEEEIEVEKDDFFM